MTIAEAITAALNGDPTLLLILTGGAHVVDEVGRNGLSSTSVPSAYDSVTGLLQPTATVYYRGDNLWGGGHDPAAKYDSLMGIAEVRLYEDGDESYLNIEAASDRVEYLLHEEFVPGAGAMKRRSKYIDREPDMNNALLVLLEFQVVYTRQLVP